MKHEKKFILWNPIESGVYKSPTKEKGRIISEGIIGRVTYENVYISVYPEYEPGHKNPRDLEINESLLDVVFHMCGTKTKVDLYRVE
jgi:hypothetical protein